MLAATRYFTASTDAQRPTLVFLHGLLGDGSDWQSLLPYLADWPCLTVDLPGHGASRALRTPNFDGVSQQLRATLMDYGIARYVLIGYSLGGRCAMYHGCFGDAQGLVGLVIEGGHPGLTSKTARDERAQHDRRWADAFRQQPLPDVLAEWYRQPVFANLTDTARQQLIARRSRNDGFAVADMLQATALSRQPWLTERLQQRLTQYQWPFCYLCGEQDPKFQHIALENHFPLRIVTDAGHNAHSANPAGFASQLLHFLKECTDALSQ